MRQAKYSLFTALGLIIVSVVICVVGTYSTLSYFSTKSEIVEEITLRSETTITTLQKNIAPYIEAYAINEYETLILNEMDFEGFFAIIVTDYNMGEILGSDAYVSGKIRNADWTTIDYDLENREQNKALENCFHTDTATIDSASGNPLGTITICNSDRSVHRELRKTIIENLIYTVSIALFLILILLFTINRVVLRPVSNMVDSPWR